MKYVVLHHTEWPGHADHFDLMLQTAGGENDNNLVLRTFATLVDSFPSGNAERLREIQRHRRIYLTYQGALSDGRGYITRVDEGTIEIDSVDRPLDESWIKFRLSGHVLRGDYRLSKVTDAEYTFSKI